MFNLLKLQLFFGLVLKEKIIKSVWKRLLETVRYKLPYKSKKMESLLRLQNFIVLDQKLFFNAFQFHAVIGIHGKNHSVDLLDHFAKSTVEEYGFVECGIVTECHFH